MAAAEPSKRQPRKPAAKKPVKKATKKAPATRPPATRRPPPSAAPKYVPPAAPDGLGPAGSRLWRSLVDVYEFRPDELRVLEDACQEVKLIDRLQSELDQGSRLMEKGSQGQPVASPLVQELRQHRLVFASLMARLKLEDVDGGEPDPKGAGAASARARVVANARWRRK